MHHHLTRKQNVAYTETPTKGNAMNKEQKFLRDLAKRLNDIADKIDTEDENLEEIDQTIFTLEVASEVLRLWRQNRK